MTDNDRQLQVQEQGIMGGALPLKQMKAQFSFIKEYQLELMTEGVHYGKIPGTKEASLWKKGADTLHVAFRLAPEYRIEDLSTPDCFRYRVTTRMIHAPTGTFLGEGVGECSTMEEKYQWRACIGDEYEKTPIDRRREKFKKSYGGGSEVIKQVRTEFHDQANTVLKMATKRSNIAAILTVTGAGDIFADDEIDIADPVMRPAAQSMPHMGQTSGQSHVCSKCQKTIDDAVYNFSIF